MLVEDFQGADHDARERYLRVHAEEVYAALTDDYAIALRAEELVYAAAERFPGLTPTRVANRRAMRAGQEPLDLFRAYMATYAREQAYCHFSPALIRNLERNWNAHERRL